jgi:N-acyl-phosphatidylethanolamine-hydrolysing phospholipase D
MDKHANKPGRRTLIHACSPRLLPIVVLLATAAWLVEPVMSAETDAAPAPAHHRGDRFQNNHVDFEPRSLAEVLRWKMASLRDGLPRPPTEPIPSVAPDLGFIAANAGAGGAMQPAVTWIGHATVLAQLGGLNLLTDPVFSERASPLSFAGPKRHQPPGVALTDLPRVDLVLVSHNHYDHLDEPSVRALASQPGGPPIFIVPLGLKAWMAAHGITDGVIELDWWQTHTIATPAGQVDVVLTPVQHWSARGLNDRMMTLWGGYAVFAPDCHLFFSGDTAYSKDFSDIHERFKDRQRGAGGFDVALTAIGAYEPRWFMRNQHVNPAEAVQIHLDLAAKLSIGVHWGTFELTDESLDEPPRALAAARRDRGVADASFVTLSIGETRRIPRRETDVAAVPP